MLVTQVFLKSSDRGLELVCVSEPFELTAPWMFHRETIEVWGVHSRFPIRIFRWINYLLVPVEDFPEEEQDEWFA